MFIKRLKLVGTILITIFVLASQPAVVTVAQNDSNFDLRIAFVSNRDGNENIYVMLTDGSSQVRLTTDEARDWHPEWSPDGSQILFNSNRDGYDALYIMSFDGSNQRRFFSDEGFNDYDGAWSPDGSRIAFVSNRGGFGRELFIADGDGSIIEQITDLGLLIGDPTWSPDASEIVYWQLTIEGDIALYRHKLGVDEIPQLLSPISTVNGSPIWIGDRIYFDTDRDSRGEKGSSDYVENWSIYVMQSNSNSPQRISDEGVNSGRPTLSPDGTLIAFVTDRDRLDSDEIYVMNVDGSFPKRLTENGYSDHSPVWQPANPPNQTPPPTPIPSEESVVENDSNEDDDSIGPAVGLSVNGVIAIPITKDTLLLNYGIREWHDAGWLGEGIKVGVIDTAFGNLEQFEEDFIPVVIPVSMEPSTDNVDNRHGTHVLEVIHAVAPEAELYACRYQGDINKLRDCTDWMLRNDVFIINHSVGIPLIEPDGTNEWAQLVDEVFENGAFWVNSSGNFQQSYVVDRFEENPDKTKYHNFVLGNGEPRPLIVRVEPGESYSGTVLLSWNSSEQVINPDTGNLEQVDLDLEVTSRASNPEDVNNIDDPAVFGLGQRPQREDFSMSQYEIAYIDKATETFQIDVKNAGLDFDRQMEFSIVIEFAPIDEVWLSPNGSVVAPSDATSSLTVGAVNGDREIAVYSSEGAVGTSNLKPDIFAPGEIYLRDGIPFIGTSAAAPVISGMAALILQADEGVIADTLPSRFKNNLNVPLAGTANRVGLVQLSAPPARDDGTNIIDTPPFTVFPQPNEEFIDQGFSCPGAPDSRFEIDVPGYVTYDLGLAIRRDAGEEFTELDRLDLGKPFTVIGGPKCAGSSLWWKIELDNGADGWVSEGLDYYLISPKSLERAQLPKVYETECPNALDTALSIGAQAQQTIGNRFFFRGEGGNEQLDPVSNGAIVHILGGPTCEGNRSNELRWFVRVLEGDSRLGIEGWIAEGGTQSRNLIPMTN